MKRLRIAFCMLLCMVPLGALAQQRLTLEECRQMAVTNDKALEQARTKVEMAGYDRGIARANYFPKLSATGAYLYNNESISLVSADMSSSLTNLGTAVQGQLSGQMQQLMAAIKSNPAAAAEYMSSPMWQTVIGALSQSDVSNALNALGTEIDDAFHLDIENVYVGVISLQQPLFMGGKIIAANKIARLAEELARTQYEEKYEEVLINVDQAYWQIVSVANKKKLAESYADLLHQMDNNVRVSVEAGVATESDALTVKVKMNEADMLLTKANNGLTLAKMLLCKLVGLDLSSDIVLADEESELIPVPQLTMNKDFDSIYADRTETRSLELAAQIYDGKVAVARADMMPTVALMANYIISNPSVKNGFQNDWGGRMAAGVVVSIPLFHGFEAIQKTRKAKAEATIYRTQFEDAKNLINLQVTQLRKQQAEAFEKLNMSENNLESAEENLRKATIGFEEGVVDANTALAAQTAWLQAHSEYIDSGIELQMTSVNLQKAEGNFRTQEN